MTHEEYKLTAEYQQVIERLAKDPLLFGRTCLREWLRIPSPNFHRALINAWLDRDQKYINVIAPRGHAKSTIVAGLIPLYHILVEEKGKKKFIVLVSKTYNHAKRLLGSIKEALEFDRVKQLYGNWGEETAIKWTESEVVLKDGTMILCMGTGQQARGLKHGAQRPTLIIGDDLEDENNTKTAEAMKFNRQWWMKNLEPAIDRKRGRIFCIGTPVHQLCLCLNLSENPAYNTYHFSAESRPHEQVSLWPEHISWDELMRIKDQHAAVGELQIYYQEYCCVVTSAETQRLNPSFLKYYIGNYNPQTKTLAYTLCDKYGNVGANKTIETPATVFIGIDPATSIDNRADFTVILPVAVTATNQIFVLPFFRERSSPTDTIKEIIRYNQNLQPTRVSIESTGAQETFRDILKNVEGVYIPGISVKHTPRDRKEKRHLDIIEPRLSKGLIYIQPTMSVIYDEMAMHPRGKNDDTLDGIYYAILHAFPPPSKPTPSPASAAAQYRNKKPNSSSWMLS